MLKRSVIRLLVGSYGFEASEFTVVFVNMWVVVIILTTTHVFWKIAGISRKGIGEVRGQAMANSNSDTRMPPDRVLDGLRRTF